MADATATTILMVGNPGCGKSTLLNGLLGEVAFRSGTSPGSGLTYQFDKCEKDGVRFFDTPGLDDKKRREAAAKAITEALKQEGHYKVFFVITLEQGRVKPADVATLQIVLDAAPITDYGLVINQVQKGIMKKLQPSGPATFADEVKATLFADLKLPTEHILWVPLDGRLDAEDNVQWTMPQELKDQFWSLKGMTIKATSVADIDPATFEQKVQEREALISRLHADQAAMSEAMRRLEAAKAAREAEHRREAERLRQEKLEAERIQRERVAEAQRIQREQVAAAQRQVEEARRIQRDKVAEAQRIQNERVAAAWNAQQDQQRRDEARLREVQQRAADRERELLSGPGWQQLQEANLKADAAEESARAAEATATAARRKRWEEKSWSTRLARLRELQRKKTALTAAESQEWDDLATFEAKDKAEEARSAAAESKRKSEATRNGIVGGSGLGAAVGGVLFGPAGAVIGGLIGGGVGGAANS